MDTCNTFTNSLSQVMEVPVFDRSGPRVANVFSEAAHLDANGKTESLLSHLVIQTERTRSTMETRKFVQNLRRCLVRPFSSCRLVDPAMSFTLRSTTSSDSSVAKPANNSGTQSRSEKRKEVGKMMK